MKSTNVLILCGAVCAVSALDCSNYSYWMPAIYPTSFHMVKHNGILYMNEWYAVASQVPGSDELWVNKGACTEGADSDLEIDCTARLEWTASGVYAADSDIQHGGRAWRNVYYASGAAEEPGVGGGWMYQGSCGGSVIVPPASTAVAPQVTQRPNQSTQAPLTPAPTNAPSTTTTTTTPPTTTTTTPPTTTTTTPYVAPTTVQANTVPPVTGDGVDCSAAHRWSGTYIYSTAEELVHYKDSLYKQAYWNQGVKPDTLQGWKFVGACIAGTNTLGVPSDGSGLGPVGEERLCSCCKGCATYSSTTPICLDDVTDEWDCLNTWCPMYNSFDTQMCQKVKDEGMLQWYSGELVDGHTNWPSRVFIPYIDVSLGKIPLLTDVYASAGVKYFVLAFVTSTGSGCAGGFGGSTPVAQGATWWGSTGEINIYSQVNEIRKLGGDAIISLGGASGTELADASGCQGTDAVAKLKKAYEAVLDASKSTVLDFDIEGNAISSANRNTGWANRFQAVKQIVAERSIQVWWTLPTWPQGLTPDGKLFIRDLMSSGAPFDLVALMTMDYGDDDVICRVNGVPDMHLCEQMAIDSVANDLFEAAQELGLATKYGWSTWTDAYKVLGSTSMIGVNDVVTEKYSLNDGARSLKVWKEEKNIKMISQWSIARDSPCSQTAAASASCSGGDLQTVDFEYARQFQSFTSN